MEFLLLSLPMMHVIAATQPDYQLQQNIQPIVCTSTSMNNGIRSWVTSSCDESYIPTVTEVIVTDTKLILRGKFDAANMRSFKIKVFNQWYTYGKSPQFTALGNDWQLDISALRDSLQPGSYDVVLEFMTIDSLLYQDTIQNHITIPIKIPVQPVAPAPDSRSPLPDELADTGEAYWGIVLVGIVLSVTGVLLLLRTSNKK